MLENVRLTTSFVTVVSLWPIILLYYNRRRYFIEESCTLAWRDHDRCGFEWELFITMFLPTCSIIFFHKSTSSVGLPDWQHCTEVDHRLNEDLLNALRPRQNGRHFPDDSFKCIFLNENVWISIEISQKLVPKGSINNNPALCQIMAWRRPGDKPLSGLMMVSSLTHICVTRPQWVK